MMHGKGVFDWPNKRRYEGNYVQEKKEGYGEFSWPDGKLYKGQWKDGLQHGTGILREANMTERAGIWNMGNFTGWSTT